MAHDSTDLLTAAYWDNFANPNRSSKDMDWEQLDQVESVLAAGGSAAIDLLLRLIKAAPREQEAWLSYLLTGPIEGLWNRSDLGWRALVGAGNAPRLR